ncbi:MAG: right-handed parallel beta-helix repeat-containing protein [Candidatus Latescibacterota bacterium]
MRRNMVYRQADIVGWRSFRPAGFDKLSHRALSLSKRGATQLFRLDGLIVYLMILACAFSLTGAIFAQEAQNDKDKTGISLVPTFHCIGIYWSPAQGDAKHPVSVKFREAGQKQWREGFPLRYHPIDTTECKADYRGSLVNLNPATTYEIMLTLEGTGQRAECRGTTWSEKFPIKSTVKASDRVTTLSVDQSGSPDGYILIDGTNATIDTGNRDEVGIAVQASYVILRGFTIRNVTQHGIRILSGRHIVIENCDISKWGSEDEKGWGKDYQACVYSNDQDLRAVVIQRCKFHHPTWDTNSWAEEHGKSTHPSGPQTVAFWNSEGNHVIRYNEFWSDEDHYYNDGMGAGSNGSYRGFPGADSDIYGNYVANCWDDGIEAEGGNQNVRIWNNYIENVLIPIANAATSIGPLYVWRNVSGRSYSPPGSSWNMTHGPFIKMGFADGEQWMTGHMYFFNNTIFQEDDMGASGLGGGGRIIKHCTSRNNILHARKGERYSIAVSATHTDNDFDYDFLSGDCPPNQEEHARKGTPQYAPGAGFDFASKTGMFQLAPGSTGIDAGVVIPNFCEMLNGNRPDLGAHEHGTGNMQFGIRAQFTPRQE